MIPELKLMLALRRLRRVSEEKHGGSMVRNWKTSLFGALAAVVLAAKAFVPEPYQAIVEPVAGLLTAIGLIFAKDHNQ